MKSPEETLKRFEEHKRLARGSYRGLLAQLQGWISSLKPRHDGNSTWRHYEDFRTYGTQELEAKRRFVVDFVSGTTPRQLWDFGCNTGEFSELALESGAAEAIGFDFDQAALDLAFTRGRDKGLRFLPLFMDAANPAPAQGWAGTEPKNVASRGAPDVLLASPSFIILRLRAMFRLQTPSIGSSNVRRAALSSSCRRPTLPCKLCCG